MTNKVLRVLAVLCLIIALSGKIIHSSLVTDVEISVPIWGKSGKVENTDQSINFKISSQKH